MTEYKSEYEKFQEKLWRKHPEWEAAQREGFLLLWDKKVDLSEQEVFHDSEELQKSYPYDDNFPEPVHDQ